jgi:hypothetical protein
VIPAVRTGRFARKGGVQIHCHEGGGLSEVRNIDFGLGGQSVNRLFLHFAVCGLALTFSNVAVGQDAPPDAEAVSEPGTPDDPPPPTGDEAAPDEAAPDEAAPDEAAPDEPAPDEAAPDEAAPDEPAPDEAAPDEAAPDEADPEGEATPEAEGETEPAGEGDAPAEEGPSSDDDGDVDDDDEIESLSFYPAEEAEFGPIDPEYRGPLELSLFTGWVFFSHDLDLDTGGGLFPGVRVSFNFGEQSRLGLDVSYGTTRINFKLKDTNVQFGNQFGSRQVGSEVSIHNLTMGLTYRMTYLRWEYLTPYVRAQMGLNYFDDTRANGTFAANGTGAPVAVSAKVDSAFGFSIGAALGFDYKLSRNWSLRAETSIGYWQTDWREDENGAFVSVPLSFGVVWHFQ